MAADGERDELRRALGRVGVWTFALDGLSAAAEREAVRGIEAMGYPALWVPEGMRSKEIFAHLSLVLAATERLVACSGIANVQARHPFTMALGARTLADAYPRRVVVGLGVGHAYQAERRGVPYDRPWTRMRAYLDAMAGAGSTSPEPAGPVPLLLAALGDRMLGLAAERALGAHTYFVPVEHTARARAALGPEPLLCVEVTAAVHPQRGEARRLARRFAAEYLALPNYANNWRRLGYGEDDVAGEGSDRLLEAAFALETPEAVVARVREHLDAGADHVALQLLAEDEADPCLEQLRELAPALLAV
ncbi:MAG TPA: TIGR03620 family F420-dependent LLM class oxidoreductase [Actinomycetota bacterium]|nr:TIGR03620 family F420-dependent LLM class oxidoreductase [Actinomycetota bacterium]